MQIVHITLTGVSPVSDFLLRKFDIANQQRVCIGRSSRHRPGASPDVTNALFDCPVISRNHAELYLDPQEDVCITDVGSLHGTWVNRCRLQHYKPCKLKENDVIEIGSNVRLDDQEYEPTTFQIHIVKPDFVDLSSPAASPAASPKSHNAPLQPIWARPASSLSRGPIDLLPRTSNTFIVPDLDDESDNSRSRGSSPVSDISSSDSSDVSSDSVSEGERSLNAIETSMEAEDQQPHNLSPSSPEILPPSSVEEDQTHGECMQNASIVKDHGSLMDTAPTTENSANGSFDDVSPKHVRTKALSSEDFENVGRPNNEGSLEQLEKHADNPQTSLLENKTASSVPPVGDDSWRPDLSSLNPISATPGGQSISLPFPGYAYQQPPLSTGCRPPLPKTPATHYPWREPPSSVNSHLRTYLQEYRDGFQGAPSANRQPYSTCPPFTHEPHPFYPVHGIAEPPLTMSPPWQTPALSLPPRSPLSSPAFMPVSNKSSNAAPSTSDSTSLHASGESTCFPDGQSKNVEQPSGLHKEAENFDTPTVPDANFPAEKTKSDNEISRISIPSIVSHEPTIPSTGSKRKAVDNWESEDQKSESTTSDELPSSKTTPDSSLSRKDSENLVEPPCKRLKLTPLPREFSHKSVSSQNAPVYSATKVAAKYALAGVVGGMVSIGGLLALPNSMFT